MNNFRKMFPERATTGEDGICRWSCEIDLRKDHYSRDLLMKISLIVSGSVFLMILGAMWTAGNFSFVWIPLLICGLLPPVMWLSYKAYCLMHGNKLLVGYELGDSSVAMIRNPRDIKAVQGLAFATGLLSIAAGSPARGLCLAAGSYGAAQPVMTKFSKVRKLHGHAENSVIDLKSSFSTAQVWMHPEDYGMILDFVRERTENAVEM